MTCRIEFTVPGPSIPERKRSYRAGKFTCRVDTPDAKDYKNHVKACAAIAMAGRAPIEGPVSLEVTVSRLRPKSLPKRVTLPTTRPDIENNVKLISDGLTGIVFRDDAQIVRLIASKQFGVIAEVMVTVSPIDDTGVSA